MIEQYIATDIPGKALYDIDFNVKIRKITPIEQKYILSLSQKQQKTNKDYIDFIKKLVVIDNKDMCFEDLFWFDLQYILYKLRFITYSKYPLKLEFICNHTEDDEDKPCNQRIIHELSMGELEIPTPDDLPNLTHTIILENLGELHIRNKTVRDDITIENFAKAHKLDADDTQMRLLLLDLCAISVDRTIEELYSAALTGELTAEDIVSIETWINENVWGIKEEVKIKCPKCGSEETRAYFLSLEDFFSAF